MLAVNVDGKERLIGHIYSVATTKYYGKARVVLKLKRDDVWKLKDCDVRSPALIKKILPDRTFASISRRTRHYGA